MIFEQKYRITKKDRIKANKLSPLLILFTGYSGAGKSTLANLIEQKLFSLGMKTYILDGDNIRNGINRDLGFNSEDRRENLRRVAEISNLFIDAGIVVLAAFIAPFQEDRDNIKKVVGSENYLEVFVNTSLETCMTRDVKNLYDLAKKGKLKNMTGVDMIYEIPANPDIEIKEDLSLEESVSIIMNKINKREYCHQ